MIDLAIVGGGPGGLMTAWYIKKKIAEMANVTIFEASDRLGGKIVTEKFKTEPAMYEAGVAEIYGYAHLGPDPLRELIESFGLSTVPMDSDAVMMDGKIIHGVAGMRAAYGARTANAIEKFRKTCAKQMSAASYYEGVGKHDNDHPWTWETCEDVLDEEVADDDAKRFFKVMARSDIASEPHLTNGLNALKNFLMDVDGYIDVYSVVGGNERIVDGLKANIDVKIELNHRVLKITRAKNDKYRLDMINTDGPVSRDFDLVIMCLPHNWLTTVDWGDEILRAAMVKHVAHFDRPAHYIRVAALFDRPIWEGHVEGSWFMSEAFGGCCVYIEGARHDVGGRGVLNWLIAGSDALAYVNMDDKAIADVALKTLPAAFGDARKHVIETKIHRWISSVNTIPGGVPVRDPLTNHLPEPKENPGIVVVGDYLFDSTLNGLFDSADMATDLILSHLMRQRYERGIAKLIAGSEPNPYWVPDPSTRIDRTYFDMYRSQGPYAQVWSQFADPDYITGIIRAVWKPAKAFKLLVAGSASGELVGALRSRGIDAWGIENNRYIHGKTPEALKAYNIFGSVEKLPFKANEFDFVYETCLAHVTPRRVNKAVSELHRVTRTGVYFGSVTSDQNSDVCDRYDLLRGVKKLATWWEWSEVFFEKDFELGVDDDALLDKLWAMTVAAKKGPGEWYDDAESLRYCFFTKTHV